MRKVAADGTVTTLAGGTTNGWVDGQGASAKFYGIRSIAIGPAGSVFVLDQPAGNHIVISESLQAIGSTPSGTLLAASQCAVGQIALP